MRMLAPPGAFEPKITAYILSHRQSPGVLIGDEFVRTFEEPAAASMRYSVAAVEGRAMLVINARIFRLREELVAFHAGAVAIDDQAAVIVGPSMSGKSTTSLSLLMSDMSAHPLSDEFALVNCATGFVEPFPRLFSVRSGARKLLGLGSFDMDWEAVDPAGLFSAGWSEGAQRSAFFFIVGKGRTANARPLPLSEAIFLAVGSALASTVESSHFRVVDHVIRGLSHSRLYALTLGSPKENVATIKRLTRAVEAIA